MPANDAVRAAVEQFKTQVETFRDSDRYRTFLDAVATFHAYSPNNAWLIATRCPDASYVKGFKAWLAVGRCVRKGEKGIAIIAPRPFTRTVKTDDGEEQRAGMAFGAATVFDISQTDPLPDHPKPFTPVNAEILDSEQGNEYRALLVSALEAGGCRYTESDPALDQTDARGFWRPADRTVCVRPGPALQMLKTAVHEAAHAYTNDLGEMPYDQGEVIAESVAYVVLRHLGLTSEDYSVPYVARWLDNDPATFARSLSHIQKVANKIIAIFPA